MLFRDDYAVLAPAAAVVALVGLFPYPFIDAEGREELVVQVFRHGFAHDLAYDDRHQVGVYAVVVELGSRLEHEAAAKRLAAPVQVGLALAGALADVKGESGRHGKQVVHRHLGQPRGNFFRLFLGTEEGDDLVVRRKQSVLTGEADGRGDEGLRWDVLHHETPRNSLVNPDKSCLPSAAQK